MIGSLILWFFIVFLWAVPSLFCIYCLTLDFLVLKKARGGESPLELLGIAIIVCLPVVSFISLFLFLEKEDNYNMLKKHRDFMNSVYKCSECNMFFRVNQLKELPYGLIYEKYGEYVDYAKRAKAKLECPNCKETSDKERMFNMERKELEIPYTRAVSLSEAFGDLFFTNRKVKLDEAQKKKQELDHFKIQLEVKDSQIEAWSKLSEKKLEEIKKKYLSDDNEH